MIKTKAYFLQKRFKNRIKLIMAVWSLLFLLSSAVFLVSGCTSIDDKNTRPNIIFILADDMGYNIPGAYGENIILTPNIDALAKKGMMFTQAYAGNSVCGPSRASLMTGLHTGHTTLRGNTGGISINDEDITLAEVLKNAGYHTGGFGKWGLGDVGTPGVPEKQGFDKFFGYYHQIHAHFYYTDYLWENSNKVAMPNTYNDSASYTHYRILKEMKSFIQENRSEPFFCFGSWTLPHTNDLDSTVIPENDPAYLMYKDKPWSDQVKKYAAMNTLVDAGVGEIWDLVKELGIEENTILIYASDNGGGETFDSTFDVSGKLKGFKHQFYEGGIKVPLIYYWKGKIEAGVKNDQLTYFPDFMPTIAELAGATNYLPITDGVSMVPSLIQKGEQKKHDLLYWELPAYNWSKNCYKDEDLQQAIRVGKWKMLRHATNKKWELYNLEDDPFELQDLADEKAVLVKRFVELIENNRTEIPAQIEPEMPLNRWYR